MDFKDTSIEDVELVFFDVETTGLNPANGDTICEIGGIKIKDSLTIDTFQTLVNPKRPIPKETSAIHKIFDEDVKNEPYFEGVVDKFLYFLGSSIICGYNIGFDIGFLNSELSKIHYPPIKLPSIDILLMARRTIKNLDRYNLSSLAQHLKLKERSFHRALQDAHITKDIFFKIKNILINRGINKVQDFITLYGFNNDFLKKNQEPKMALIKESIIAQVMIQISYLSYSNNLRTFMVTPQGLLEYGGKTYLLGSTSKSKDALRFSLDRILNVEVV